MRRLQSLARSLPMPLVAQALFQEGGFTLLFVIPTVVIYFVTAAIPPL